MKDNSNMKKQIAIHGHKEKLKEPVMYNFQKKMKKEMKIFIIQENRGQGFILCGKGQQRVT